MRLIIGNKNYSSWSLRPWLVLEQFGIPFDETLIKLDCPQTAAEIQKYSQSGKVPALIDNDFVVWESLAICEYLNDKYPEKNLWPKDIKTRAWARSISNEMHGGFQTLRTHMPHNLKKNVQDFDCAPARTDIERIKKIWSDCLATFKGPFLFGEFTIADAMFAPVVNRFMIYRVPLDGTVKNYVDTMRALPALQKWNQAGMAEDFVMPRYEQKP